VTQRSVTSKTSSSICKHSLSRGVILCVISFHITLLGICSIRRFQVTWWIHIWAHLGEKFFKRLFYVAKLILSSLRPKLLSTSMMMNTFWCLAIKRKKIFSLKNLPYYKVLKENPQPQKMSMISLMNWANREWIRRTQMMKMTIRFLL